MKKICGPPLGTGTAAFLLFLLMAGCRSTPLPVEGVDLAQDPVEAVAELGRELEQAAGAQVDLLAPSWFRRSSASLAAARSKSQSGASAQEILQALASARAELRQAEVVAIRARDQLAEVLAARQAARSVNAQRFAAEFAAAEKDFSKLARAIENDEFAYARQRRDELAGRYRDLEVRAVDQSALGPVRDLLQKARQAKVPEMAPKAFKEALDAMSEAQAQIAADPRDGSSIRQKADRVDFLAQRALVVAETSRRIAQMKPEDIALWMETFFFQTSSRLQATDRRNTSLEEQQGAILAAVDALRVELTLTQKSEEDKTAFNRRLGERLAEAELSVRQIRQEQQRLVAEKRLLETFIQLQAGFEPQEAELLRNAEQVIIRIKGLQFTRAGAVVESSGGRLLHKVQEAILALGAREVILQNPTESGSGFNPGLSAKRAESVRDFLLAGMPAGRVSISVQAGHPGHSPPTVATAEKPQSIDVRIMAQMSDRTD